MTKPKSHDRALQRAIARDGRVVTIRGHVLADDYPAVRDMMKRGAAVVDEIRGDVPDMEGM